jgi:hypothetical protein
MRTMKNHYVRSAVLRAVAVKNSIFWVYITRRYIPEDRTLRKSKVKVKLFL